MKGAKFCMNYQDIYSIAKFESQHIIGITEDDINNYTPFFEFQIYGIPESLCEKDADSALFDKNVAVSLGTISGRFVLGREIDRTNEDLLYVCDAADQELEFAVSALLEYDGPLNCISLLNHFHIYELKITDKSVFSEIIESLPDILLTHCHVYPDIISIFPAPLSHDESIYDKINRDMATIAYADTMKRIQNGHDDSDKPQLTLSEEQMNIMLGRRNEGYTYPEQYKNREIWDLLKASGFIEWRNTRVLFMTTENEIDFR